MKKKCQYKINKENCNQLILITVSATCMHLNISPLFQLFYIITSYAALFIFSYPILTYLILAFY